MCGRDGCKMRLGLDADGFLWKGQVKSARDIEWQPVLFNENYEGYYPACTFTSIVATDVDFVAAGNGEDGLPYVYRSLMGGVWESANLMAGSALNGFVRVAGKINHMLYDGKTRQIFLLCDNGELVTMPDCPKCVRVRKVTDCALVSGYVDAGGKERAEKGMRAGAEECAKKEVRAGEEENARGGLEPSLILTNERGEQIILNAYEMTQVRASYSYVKEQLKKGGWLVDLRGRQRKFVPGDVSQNAQSKLWQDGAGQNGQLENGKVRMAEDGRLRRRQGGLPEGVSAEQVLYMDMEEVEEWLEEQPKETFLAFLCEYGAQADEAAHYARRQHFSRAYSLGGAGEKLHVR